MSLETELKKMPILLSKSNEAVKVFHRIHGGQSHKLVKASVEHNMPNTGLAPKVTQTLTAESWRATSWTSWPSCLMHTNYSLLFATRDKPPDEAKLWSDLLSHPYTLHINRVGSIMQQRHQLPRTICNNCTVTHQKHVTSLQHLLL